jgi:hypothetical protein
MTQRVRIAISAAAMGSLMLLTPACSSTPTAVSTDSTIASSKSETTTTVKESVETTTTEETTDTTTKSIKGTTSVPKKATTTTKPAKLTGAEFAQAAITAFKAKVGEDFKGLQITVNFNSASNRAELQAQDPAKPANVDAYEYTGTDVDGPTPVKLTGDGSLEENLFAASEVAWDKLPDLFEQAKTSIGELEGSTGVTHFIVKKNLPFDSDTVINVYIDGGTRSSGGYVSFKADGTLKKVYGPS